MKKNSISLLVLIIVMASSFLLASCSGEIVEPSPTPGTFMDVGTRNVSQTLAE